MSKPSLDDLLKSVREDGKKEDPKKAARKKALENVPVSKPKSKAQRDQESADQFSSNIKSSSATAQKADERAERRKTLAAKMERRKGLEKKRDELEKKKREGEEKKSRIKSAVNAASSGPSISSGSNMEKGGPSAEKEVVAGAGKAIGGAAKAIATATGLDKKAEKFKKKLGNKMNRNKKKGLSTGVASSGVSSVKKKPADPWTDNKPKDPWKEEFSNWREDFMYEVDEKLPKEKKEKKIEPMKGTNTIVINPDSLEEGIMDNLRRNWGKDGPIQQRVSAFFQGAGRPNVVDPNELQRLRDAKARRGTTGLSNIPPGEGTGKGGPSDISKNVPPAARPAATRPAASAPRPAAPKPMTADQKNNARYQSLRTKDPEAAKKLGMEIWKNKYKDTLAKNVKTPSTPSMANQAAELKRSGLNSPESRLTTANATINSVAKSPRAKQILSGTGKSPVANQIGTSAIRTSSLNNSVEYSDWRIELDEGKKRGLWDNIHAKRKRGERPAKPGEEGYPKTLNVEQSLFSNWRDSFSPTDYEFIDLIKPDPINERNDGPSTPVKMDSHMNRLVPNQGAGRPGNVRLKKPMLQSAGYQPEGEQLDEMPYQVMGSPDGKKEKKIGKPVKSRKYADARAAELEDTHKKTGGKYRSQYVEEVEIEEMTDLQRRRYLGRKPGESKERLKRANERKDKKAALAAMMKQYKGMKSGIYSSYEPEGDELNENEYRRELAKERRAERDSESSWRKSSKVGEKKKGPKLSTTKHSARRGSDYAEKEMRSIHGHDKVTKKAKHTVGNPFPEEVQYEGAAWTKKEGQNKEGGLNEKGRKSYERENPGSDLKAPSKEVGNPRRASFCARMKGMRKRQKPSNNTGEDRLSKSLRAWNC